MRATKFKKADFICYATSPCGIAIEGLEALRDWDYLGKCALPKEIESQIKTNRFPHYIFVKDNKVIKVLV